jgi:hypothetical protein
MSTPPVIHRNQFRQDVIRLGDVDLGVAARLDSTSLGFTEDAREKMIGEIAARHGSDKATLRTKSDVYLQTRLEIAASHDRNAAAVDAFSTPRSDAAPDAQSPTYAKGFGVNHDSADVRAAEAAADAAYRANVNGLNDWRNDPQARLDATGVQSGGQPNAHVHVSTGDPALDEDAAYRAHVGGLNDWRNHR